MDSITQATLGAAVAHICWQQQLGKKSLVAGLVLGSLPDLDILLYPALDEVQRLYWHRGESHSVWFILLGSLGLSWLLQKTEITKGLESKKILVGLFLILSTHILIDVFTTYGTQLFAPISREGFALSNLFIVDPLFTLPLLVGTLGAYFVKDKKTASYFNQIGLLFAVFYVVWSLTAQTIAHRQFRSALAEQEIEVLSQRTSAGAFNTILWRHIAQIPGGYLIGYWSWLDEKDQKIQFQFIPQEVDAVKQIKSTRSFRAVAWFSQGWWFALKSDDGTVQVIDLRFTELPSDAEQSYTEWQWPFSWKFDPTEHSTNRLEPVRPDLENPGLTLKLLAQRVTGQRGWILDER